MEFWAPKSNMADTQTHTHETRWKEWHKDGIVKEVIYSLLDQMGDKFKAFLIRIAKTASHKWGIVGMKDLSVCCMYHSTKNRGFDKCLTSEK